MHLATPFLTIAFTAAVSVSAQASTLASANQLLNITGCAAPTEFTKCIAASVSKEQDCSKAAGSGSSKEKDACGCVGSVERLNCFGEACWNKVYSCEYQALAALYFTCPLATFNDTIPFWPAPTNAPGGCSCNTGQVARAVIDGSNHSLVCVKDAAKTSLTSLVEKSKGCGCCAASVAFSAFANICPNTDPTLIGLSSYTSELTTSFSWDSCTPSLTKYDCVKDLAFAAPSGNGTLYNPSNLPKTGTQTLSNTAGTITTPVSATYTWTAAGTVWNVTAVGAGSGSGNATGTGAGNGGGSQTGSAATAKNTNAGGKMEGGGLTGLLGGVLVVALGAVV